MREILFRGKRIDNGEWVEGFYNFAKWYLNGEFTGEITYYIRPVGAQDAFQVDPATVGQYTGLIDKKGKRIFEGDIVTGLLLFAMPVNGVCAFRDGAFGLLWNRGSVETFNAFTSMCNIEYEVIGNIHDNPDLMWPQKQRGS